MTATNADDRWCGLLPSIPVGGRIMLTAFLAIIGSGYLVAVLNIYHSHQLADGKKGLSLDDLRAVYSGLTIAKDKDAVIPSRMLTMIHGAMRQYIDNEEDFTILENWLKAGGSEAGMNKGPRKKTPRRVLMRHCLRCHAQSTDTEISKKSPFAPDEFDVDYAMLAKFVAPAAESSTGVLHLPPQYTVPRLVLVSHVHMLAIPMFTLVVALMFMMTRLPARLRAVLTPLPMLAVVLDLSGWWLARLGGPFVYFIIAGGAVFGTVFGIQLIAVAIDMWRPIPADQKRG